MNPPLPEATRFHLLLQRTPLPPEDYAALTGLPLRDMTLLLSGKAPSNAQARAVAEGLRMDEREVLALALEAREIEGRQQFAARLAERAQNTALASPPQQKRAELLRQWGPRLFHDNGGERQAAAGVLRAGGFPLTLPDTDPWDDPAGYIAACGGGEEEARDWAEACQGVVRDRYASVQAGAYSPRQEACANNTVAGYLAGTRKRWAQVAYFARAGEGVTPEESEVELARQMSTLQHLCLRLLAEQPPVPRILHRTPKKQKTREKA